ncbi:RNA polymerase sigma factor SigF [Nocardia sp. NBC_01327]|uniref:RNA polymerase sigma factor SigF n=1 Tax=Nocardia sp. NBC_01327 TaxID=2903593 RepID=UPI002E141080|nr:RNA polymerase sigma factor SigF [Nocardia sp. NBC_01327]
MDDNGYDNIEPALQELARAIETQDPQRDVLRNKVIERCLPLADHIARRFSGRGESFEDLQQTARIGLLHAIDRFDVSYGAPFLSFAIPTIMGEVRRHFRDYTWAVRVPRRTKEIQLRIGGTIEILAQRLGRLPKAREIADELGVDLLEITQALIAANAYQASSLDAVAGDDGESSPLPLRETLGAAEPDYELIEQAMTLRPQLDQLPERERRVLIMRFFECQTQKQIADHLGVSQMQISRILSKTLAQLREGALED